MLLLVGILFTVAGVAVVGFRVLQDYQVPGPFDQFHVGFCDFHNGVYFPAQAWARQDNPYSAEYAASYPVMRQVPLYSPLVFLTHAPLGMLSLRAAEITYFLVMLLVIGGLAGTVAYSTRPTSNFHRPIEIWVGGMLAMAVVVTSRAGHTTLHSGYFTLELALATASTLYFASHRPAWAAIALAYTSVKPTYAIPLGLVLLALGQFRLVLRAAALAVLLAVATLGWIVAGVDTHSAENDESGSATVAVLHSMLSTQDVHRGQNWEKPAVSWTRIDLLGMLAKWTEAEPGDIAHLVFMVVFLLPMAPLFWRMRNRRDAMLLTGPVASLVIIAMLLSIYHHAYDTAILVAPLFGALASRRSWHEFSVCARWCLVALLAFPLMNYFSTRMVLGRLPLGDVGIAVVCGLNTASLLLALGWISFVLWRTTSAGDKIEQVA